MNFMYIYLCVGVAHYIMYQWIVLLQTLGTKAAVLLTFAVITITTIIIWLLT